MGKLLTETKVFSNSIFNLKNRLYFAKENKENIHREATIFAPIFILNELVGININAEDDRNLYNLKWKYESNFISKDVDYKNYKTRIARIYEELEKFLVSIKKVLKEEDNEELYKFLNNNNLIKEENTMDNTKKKYILIGEEKFENLFRKMYKLILSINYSIIKEEKLPFEKMNETFSSLFEKEFLNLKKEKDLYKEENFSVNIQFLRDEIYKRFMFNDLNLLFYNLLIDLQLLSIDEIMYSGFEKINVIENKENELEDNVKRVFYDCIKELDTKNLRFLTDEYSIENLEQNFTFEYFDKLKAMDIININFEISEDLKKDEVNNHIKEEKIEEIKFAIVCQLLESKLIDNSKKNILKNIKVIGIKAKNNEKHESGIKNIIYIRLPKIDLEINLELELVVKVFSKTDKIVFQYTDVRNTETRLRNLEYFRTYKNDFAYKMPHIKSGNEFFNNLLNYTKKITESGITKSNSPLFKYEADKIIVNDLTKKVIVNPINVEIMGKSDNFLSKTLLKIYLYIYMQCLYLMAIEEKKDIGDFKEFLENLKNFNFDTVRMKMLKYINYYYYSRYNMREKFDLNQKLSSKAKDTFMIVEKIINNNYSFLLLSKLSEFVYLQILNIFYFNNIIDVEYIKSGELKESLELDEKQEKEFIKNIINYFGKYKNKFSEDFSYMLKE